MYRVDVNAAQNLGVERVERLVRDPVCSKILPMKSQESTTLSHSYPESYPGVRLSTMAMSP